MLNHNEAYWQQKGAHLTVSAILNQPRLWQEGLEQVKQQQEVVTAFWQACPPGNRILITGAGSSLLAAQAAANWLRSVVSRPVEIVPATDLILQPHPIPSDIVLVSVSSSGNTPETVNVTEQILSAAPQTPYIAITNNPSSRLAKLANHSPTRMFIPAPDGTSNGSFAATSEFTIPMWYTMLLLVPEQWHQAERILPLLQRGASYFFEHEAAGIEQWAAGRRNNVVALGALSLKAIACESSLKLLEMGNGQVMTAWHSMLEFRHGPKLIINRDATVVGYMAANPDIHRYDKDMLVELRRERSPLAQIVAIGHDALPDHAQVADRYFHFACPELADFHEAWAAMLYVLFAQLAGLYCAIKLGVTPDMPSRDGKVAKVANVTVY
ncbi:SIS domain-containing protein [Atlantibacter subterraneus]|uniref:SIS domain-containing protein n=1 Tax=Atlantibacter subterraneus TaxID=255519 RepID=UPI00124C6F71|nr:SIS domain-containing protein [Atlantibacter subterranea]MDW2745195.1 SIS domain-containing protein [Atlantibacter subterranea]QFH69435.1 SIS domain-containing protein [Enterobacter sp. E76]